MQGRLLITKAAIDLSESIFGSSVQMIALANAFIHYTYARCQRHECGTALHQVRTESNIHMSVILI